MLVNLFFTLLSLNAQTAVLLNLKGSINPGSANYLIEQIELVQADERVRAIIIELDTPGGLLSSTRDIIQAFNQSNKPIIVWVTPAGASATSAGALITVSAHGAWMEAGTNIGAAHPVGPSGEEAKGVMNDKVTQDTAALIRSQAELRGRSTVWAEQMVTKSLSFTAEEALRKKLIDQVTEKDSSPVELLNRWLEKRGEQNLVKEIVFKPMSLKQKVLHHIADPNISTILMTLGGLALYTEVSSGFSLIVPGIVGLFLLLLAGISLQMLPISTGAVSLMILGLALLLAELWINSLGLLALGGLTCVFLGSLFLTDAQWIQWSVSQSLLLGLFAPMALILAGFSYLIWRDKKYKTQFVIDSMVGQEGVITYLYNSNSGLVQVAGELWSCQSSKNLELNQKVKILKQSQSVLEVEPLEEASSNRN